MLSYPEDKSIHAMVLKHMGKPLEWTKLADRTPGPGEARVRTNASGICRTDLLAYLTRQDGLGFLKLAPGTRIITRTTVYPLRQANQARAAQFEGDAVLVL